MFGSRISAKIALRGAQNRRHFAPPCGAPFPARKTLKKFACGAQKNAERRRISPTTTRRFCSVSGGSVSEVATADRVRRLICLRHEILQLLQRTDLHNVAGRLGLERGRFAGEWVRALAFFGRGLVLYDDLGQAMDRERLRRAAAASAFLICSFNASNTLLTSRFDKPVASAMFEKTSVFVGGLVVVAFAIELNPPDVLVQERVVKPYNVPSSVRCEGAN